MGVYFSNQVVVGFCFSWVGQIVAVG